ncbi:MAG: hypothetical protein NC430_12615 [bacterium]|nr:hypothetical protein [bacterium]MCM1424615.1 hypothetical protein [bacterium]
MFVVKKPHKRANVPKTIRFTEELNQQMESLALKTEVSFARYPLCPRDGYAQRLVALGAMLEEGQTEKAKGEIARMLRENSLNRHGTAETGNLTLDALVNYKYDAALSEGIRMECHLEVL